MRIRVPQSKMENDVVPLSLGSRLCRPLFWGTSMLAWGSALEASSRAPLENYIHMLLTNNAMEQAWEFNISLRGLRPWSRAP